MINADKTSKDNSTWYRIAGFLQAYEWWLIGISFLIITCLGWYGFLHIHHKPEDGTYTIWDNLYLALQLFFMNSGDQRSIGTSLQVARFLAPIVVAWASIKALFPFLRESLNMLKLNSYRNHIVICGIGKKGMELVNIFTGKGKKVVVIEIDEENDNLAGCRQREAVVLIGNAKDDFLLKKANIQRAGYLFAVTGDDNTNVAIAGKAYALLKNMKRREGPLQCFIHIFDIRLRNLFEQHEIFNRSYEQFNARLFNVYDESARFILGKYAPDCFVKCNESASPPVNIIVIGFGWTGETIVEQAIRMGHYGNEKSLRITILDQMAKEKEEKFLSRYKKPDTQDSKFLDDIELNFIEKDIERLSSLNDLKVDVNNPPAVVYVCLGSDTLGTFTAVRLRKLFGSFCKRIVRIVVCLKEGKSTLFESENFNRMNENIYSFNMPEYACSMHVETETDLDTLAQLVHSKYVVDFLEFSRKTFDQDAAVEVFWNAISGDKYDELSLLLKRSWDVINSEKALDRIEGMLKKMNALLRISDFYDAWDRKHPGLSKQMRVIKRFVDASKSHRTKGFHEMTVSEQETVLRLNLSILLATYTGKCPNLIAINSSLNLWEDLTEEIKDSNRYQADHISVKLRAVGYDTNEVIPIEELKLKLAERTTMEKLAKMEHRRWMAEKLMAGWSRGDKRKDFKKEHPLLVPFEELDDNEKKKDYSSIANIPLLVSTENWKNYKRLMALDNNV